MSVDISVQADISPAKSIHIRTMLTIRPMILLRGIQFRVLLIGCIRTERTVIAIPLRNISKKHSFNEDFMHQNRISENEPILWG